MALPTGAKVFYAKDKHVIGFGNGSTRPDVQLQWDGTNFIIDALTDDALIEFGDSAATQKSFDLKWYGDSASGASYLYFDASLNLIYTTGVDHKLIDNDHLFVGTGTAAAAANGDVDIYWDATNLIVGAAADDLLIEVGDSAVTQKSFDVKWYANEASGASYVYFDASANLVYTTGVDVKLLDNDHILIGTATGAANAVGDVDAYWDATNLIIAANADDTLIEIADSAATQKSFDLKWYANEASGASYVYFDASANLVYSTGVDVKLIDNDHLFIGTATSAATADGDVDVYWDATNLIIAATADDSLIEVGDSAATQKSFDLKWYANEASGASYVYFDASTNLVYTTDVDVKLIDNDILNFGTATGVSVADGDVQIRWDGTDLDVLAAADDSVIKFGTGTNSFDMWVYGNIATAYTLWDASANEFGFRGPVRFRAANTLSPRFELKWVAGQRGKPSINGDIQNAAEGTRMIADPDFEILGVNATSDDSTFYAEGGILVETDGADGDEVIILPHLDANQSAWSSVTWGTDQETEWECDIQTTANITNCIIWAGLKLTNTEVTATDADQVFFRYEDDINTGKWQAIDSIANVDNAVDSAVTAAINTRYHLKITIGSDRVARFYINGVLVSTSAALTNTIDLIPYIGVATDGAVAAKSLRVHGQAISRKIA